MRTVENHIIAYIRNRFEFLGGLGLMLLSLMYKVRDITYFLLPKLLWHCSPGVAFMIVDWWVELEVGFI